MTRKRVQQQFGANAQRYVSSDVHARGASLSRMVELAAPQSHWLAVDVAPGGGHSALAIAPHVRQVLAVDITWPMLQAARAFTQEQGITNIRWVQGDGARLPLADAQVDLITCRVALHHFSDQAAAIQEWARCLKPGGRLVLVDNIGPDDSEANRYVNRFETLRDPSHGHLYPLSELLHFVDAAGLHVLTHELLHKPMGFYPWMTRMQVTAADQERLSHMLWQSSGPAHAFLNPQGEGESTTFTLWEGIILAGK